MPLPEILAGFRSRPGMYLTDVSLDATIAFLIGFDCASSFGVFVGFKEWLVLSIGEGENFAWDGLVRRKFRAAGLDEKGDGAAEFVMVEVESFWEAKCKRHGLEMIFFDYHMWLQRKSPSGP